MYSKDNKKFPYTLITNSIRISVMTEFLEEQSDINENLWVWAYHIAIENNGIKTVQLLERYWKIIDESGKVTEGEHIIGDLIKRADDHGVSVPIMKCALAAIQTHEAKLLLN